MPMSCSFPCPKKGRIKAPPVVPLRRKKKKSRHLFEKADSCLPSFCPGTVTEAGAATRSDQDFLRLLFTRSWLLFSSCFTQRWLVSLKTLPWNAILRKDKGIYIHYIFRFPRQFGEQERILKQFRSILPKSELEKYL